MKSKSKKTYILRLAKLFLENNEEISMANI